MELLNLAAVVVALAVVVLVAVLVPALQQLRKTLEATEVSMKSLNALVEEEVRPAVKSINALVAEMDEVVKVAKDGVMKVDDTIGAFHEVGETVRSLNTLLDTKLKGTVVNLLGYAAGIKAGAETLYKVCGLFKQKEAEL
ncbi:MAG: DUF948 domain-containing protein [Nitrospirae bacterium]|nr:DUF948 domain-containing protein [Nitrospirota bacterium]MBI5694603.1 DUF948 domain-containing protein [Nitrospirota bacterium]